MANAECYIDYLDASNNFEVTRKDFKTYDDALHWMKNESGFEKWSLDMIGYY